MCYTSMAAAEAAGGGIGGGIGPPAEAAWLLLCFEIGLSTISQVLTN